MVLIRFSYRHHTHHEQPHLFRGPIQAEAHGDGGFDDGNTRVGRAAAWMDGTGCRIRERTLRGTVSTLHVLDSRAGSKEPKVENGLLKLENVDSKLQHGDRKLQDTISKLENAISKLQNSDSKLEYGDSKLENDDLKLQNDHVKWPIDTCNRFDTNDLASIVGSWTGSRDGRPNQGQRRRRRAVQPSSAA